jgi:hypothetical protein
MLMRLVAAEPDSRMEDMLMNKLGVGANGAPPTGWVDKNFANLPEKGLFECRFVTAPPEKEKEKDGGGEGGGGGSAGSAGGGGGGGGGGDARRGTRRRMSVEDLGWKFDGGEEYAAARMHVAETALGWEFT